MQIYRDFINIVRPQEIIKTMELKFSKQIILLIFICLILPISPVFSAQEGTEYTSFFGFTLNKVTLSEIQSKLGNAPIIETGDAGDYEASICYLLPSGYTISFLSGELGGSNHEFLGYSVRRTSEREDNCLKINSSTAIDFKPQVGKLRIGMTKIKFTQTFGKKIRWLEGNRALVSFESRRKMTKQELQNFKKTWPSVVEYPYFDIVIGLTGKFKEDLISEFIVWKTETN